MDLWYQFRRLADLDPVQIDGWVFRLHYWVTSTGIFAASAIAFAKQYFGDPIECIFVSAALSLIVTCLINTLLKRVSFFLLNIFITSVQGFSDQGFLLDLFSDSGN